MTPIERERNYLRDAINSCRGYRILEAHEVLQPGDETVCGSLLLSPYGFTWAIMDDEHGDWGQWFGQTVEWANEEAPDMDASERLFRRKV